jgi:hypothetical protein
VLAGALTSGCTLFMGEPCIRPFSTAVVEAVVRVPVPLEAAWPERGACGAWVEYDDAWYDELRPSPRQRGWTLTDADLEPVGTASGRTAVTTPIVDATVFSIDGVDSTDAVAMHAAPAVAGSIVVLARQRGGAPLPDALCRYLAEGASLSGCETAGSGAGATLPAG